MDSFVVKDGKQLRLGYTTGSCAAAAAKAAARMLLSGETVETVRLLTPKGITLELPVLEITRGTDSVSCAIRKDSGDDPDVTDGTLIFASVSLISEEDILIDGGEGVGRVTKPGLDQPVGAAAINSVPRRMIRENLLEVCELLDYHGGLSVVISAPEGEKLAQRTFNSRLGITGGISILGTSGIVEPMSEQALIDTIRLEIRQRREEGKRYILLTPGNYGKTFLENGLNVDPSIPVMTSNFIGDALDCCKEAGFEGVLLVGHIGKLVKIAGNMMNTHSRYGDCRMEIMTSHAAACGLSPEKAAEMLECATCDDALRILREEGLYERTLARLIGQISVQLNRRTGGEPPVEAVIFSNVYGILAETENAGALKQRITGEY
ncbi:MAG: cobalamin biosynthesis protein CbiD [Flexilinea sp.]|nr:cobalamin biosynthesis protein CbiD [Flexilinea sp.]